MQVTIKYKAIDGIEFNKEVECLDYEALIYRVQDIMSQLPVMPEQDNCNFSNGHGFIQHDKKLLRLVQLNLLEEIKRKINHPWIQQTIDDEKIHHSYVGRLLGDYNINPLSKAWYRFSCIDDLGREWGQPYFANNPDKGEHLCLN